MYDLIYNALIYIQCIAIYTVYYYIYSPLLMFPSFSATMKVSIFAIIAFFGALGCALGYGYEGYGAGYGYVPYYGASTGTGGVGNGGICE